MPVLFLAFWFILNARFGWDVLIIGVLVSILASLFAYRLMGLSFATEGKVWARIGKIIAYLFTLVIEVVKANIHMIGIILSSVIEIKPQIIYFKSPVRSEAAKVALANSITLTPGTITIKLDDDNFGIHAIDAPLGDGIENSVFVEKLKKIEGGH